MKQLYALLDNIKDRLRANGITNTVSFGDIMDVDLNKTTIYPLAHIILGNTVFDDKIMTVTINIIAADIVDSNKLTSSFDSFYGNNNLQDVLNGQLQGVNDIQSHLQRGLLYNADLRVTPGTVAEPFQDRYENDLAGWAVTFNIEIPNIEYDI